MTRHCCAMNLRNSRLLARVMLLGGLCVLLLGCKPSCRRGLELRGGQCFPVATSGDAGKDAEPATEAMASVTEEEPLDQDAGLSDSRRPNSPKAGGGGAPPDSPSNGGSRAPGAHAADGGSSPMQPMAGAPAAAVCGNGMREQGELCDGADCATECVSTDKCITQRLDGSPATCDVKCEAEVISACQGNDGCCPEGCNHGTDTDCSMSCGDGVVGDNEKCERGHSEYPCPTECDDADPCTEDHLVGSEAQCSASCTHTPVVAPSAGDRCCPEGANAMTDGDCPTRCGDGVVTDNETCDPASSQMPCPRSCDDGDACTDDVAEGRADQCNVACKHNPVTLARSGDGCCPGRANASNDDDCPTRCGDGVVTGEETCDPQSTQRCPTASSCRSMGCKEATLMGSADRCDAVCNMSDVRAPEDGDGCCPDGAHATTPTAQRYAAMGKRKARKNAMQTAHRHARSRRIVRALS